MAVCRTISITCPKRIFLAFCAQTLYNQPMGEAAKKATLEDLQELIRKSEVSRIEGEKALRESLRESLREVHQAQRKTELAQQKGERSMEEVHQAQKKGERSMEEIRQIQKQTEKSLDKLQKSLDKTNGNFNNKWGKFVENLVRGDLVKLLHRKNIKVNRVQPRLTYPAFGKNRAGELDLVAINGEEIVVVEVKSTLEKADVRRFLEKLRVFRQCPTEYAGKTVYGAVAFIETIKDAEAFAEEAGMLTIRAPGGESDICVITNTEGFAPRPIV